MRRFFLPSDKEGFTLVDVMLGITILSLALLPFMVFFANSTRIVHNTEIRSQALKIARDALEIIKGKTEYDWSFLDNLNAFCINNIYDSATQDYDLLVDYTLTAAYLSGYDFNGDGNTTNDLDLGRKVIVTVGWNDVTGTDRQVKIETIIAKR
jgi:type II secretory pathway pseudopilin PulG